MNRTAHRVAFGGVLLLATSLAMPARADMPMFWFIAFGRISYWWAIPVAVAIEAVFLRWAFGLSALRAALLSLVMNAVSAFVGFLAYPAVGMFAYGHLAPVVTDLFGTGVIVEAGATLTGLILVDWAVEMLVIVIAVSVLPLTLSWGRAGLVLLANAISTTLIVGLVVAFPQARLSDPDAPDWPTDAELAALDEAYHGELELMGRLQAALLNAAIEGEDLTALDYAPWRDEARALAFQSLKIDVIQRSDGTPEVVTLVGAAAIRDRAFSAQSCFQTLAICASRTTDPNVPLLYRLTAGASHTTVRIEIIGIVPAPQAE